MIIRSESRCPDELTKKKFIDRIIVYEVLSELEQKIVLLWQWNFNRFSKLGSICPEELFQEIFFLEEHKQFNNLIQISSEVFFRFLWKNWNSGKKKSAKLSKLLFMLPAGLFQRKYFFPKKKNQIRRHFPNSSSDSCFFWKISGIFLKSATLRPDEFVEEKCVFFGAKVV